MHMAQKKLKAFTKAKVLWAVYTMDDNGKNIVYNDIMIYITIMI